MTDAKTFGVGMVTSGCIQHWQFPFYLPLTAKAIVADKYTLRLDLDHHLNYIKPSDMPRPTNRSEALARLRETIASGKAIVGAGAGQPPLQVYQLLHVESF